MKSIKTERTEMGNISEPSEPSELYKPSDNIKTFMLIFMAIIWRRVWITSAIYCEHNKLNLSNDIVLKALKYNIFSDAGMESVLKPYITKAFSDGFLMPSFYEKNIYATKAVKLYKSAHDIIKSKNKFSKLLFLKEYALSIFKMDKGMVNEATEETKDAINIDNKSKNNIDTNNTTNFTSEYTSGDFSDTSGDSESPDLNRKNNDGVLLPLIIDQCDCKLCKLVNSWDVNTSLIFSDPFQNVLMFGLNIALKNTSY